MNLYKWVKCDNKYKFRNDLNRILPKYFIKKAQYYNSNIHTTTDESNKIIYDRKAN